VQVTPQRRGRVVENDQYAAFVGRVIAAYSRRIAAVMDGVPVVGLGGLNRPRTGCYVSARTIR